MYIHACKHTCMHTHLHAAKFSYTHPCMHPRIHLYMRVFKIKASDHSEKKNKYIDLGLHVILLQVSEVIEECFWLLYCLKAI